MKLKVQGFTLTELMIALVLGSFLIGGVVMVYIGHQQSLRHQRTLVDIQQASQSMQQLLRYDLRQAGFLGCANALPERLVNALQTTMGQHPWWARWTSGVRGYSAGAVPRWSAEVEPVADQDAVHLMYGAGQSASVVLHQPQALPALVINNNQAGFRTGDVVLGCDPRMAVIFQLTSVAGNQLNHQVGVGSPGNASLNFGFAVNGVAQSQALAADSGMLLPLQSVGWFVGETAGQRDLYRVSLSHNQLFTEKILSRVNRFQLRYLLTDATDYVSAAAVLDWSQVKAVHFEVELADTDDTISKGLRTIAGVVSLRNHQEDLP